MDQRIAAINILFVHLRFFIPPHSSGRVEFERVVRQQFNEELQF